MYMFWESINYDNSIDPKKQSILDRKRLLVAWDFSCEAVWKWSKCIDNSGGATIIIDNYKSRDNDEDNYKLRDNDEDNWDNFSCEADWSSTCIRGKWKKIIINN